MKRVLFFLFLILRLTAAQAQYPVSIKPAGDSLSMQTISDWMQAAGEVGPTQSPYGVALLNNQSHLVNKTAPYSLSDWYGYGLVVAPVPFTTCGAPFVVAHVGGTVAAVSKTVSYGTVTSSLTGSPKCWITQNLGADQQASSATDASEASAGWYFQFNRAQGYKVADDGVTRTPASAWNATISEASDWVISNDPCALLLGTGWRIPTNTELTNANSAGGWYPGYSATYASELKIHAAGFLYNYGLFSSRGNNGIYWGSSQASATNGGTLTIYSYFSTIATDGLKACGFTLRCLNDFASCGSPMVITHTAGAIAPVTKTVTYGTVATNLTGTNKCWITQNLGADNQATSATDATEPSAGWYFQFNRVQGFKHDGTTRTPATTWNTSISESTDWVPANDPCTQLLGSGWRIPTYSEWNSVFNVLVLSSPYNYTIAYASLLKLHASGYLSNADGSLLTRGSKGYFNSSTQSGTVNSYFYDFDSGGMGMASNSKTYGWSARCLKDLPTPFTTCGNSFVVNHAAGAVAPVTKTVTYGTVMSGLSGAGKCWITQNLGADHQATAVTDATEASSGWFWQFNRQQGYKMTSDGVTRTPNTVWINSISESSDWVSPNDPCTQLLGSGWRIPTQSEWINANTTGAWTNYTLAYSSVLKLHAAGDLYGTSGALSDIGNTLFWSSTQASTGAGLRLFLSSASSSFSAVIKSFAFPLRCLQDISPTPYTTCGSPFTVTHTAGINGAPVTKTVSYGTVSTALAGTGGKCWITQNLGADQQATSATDSTETSAGWYFQFNRTQGYKHDGITRTPSTTWDVTNDALYTGWDPAKDPCTLLLGSGWRLPTQSEWTNANTPWSSTGIPTVYNSALKLHAAGCLDKSSGALGVRNSYGYYWSSAQVDASRGWLLNFGSGFSGSGTLGYKAYGFSVRCLQDFTPVAFTGCGNAFVITHTAGTVAPVTKTVSYSTVLSSLSGTPKCWITQNLGADQQATSATDGSDASAGWYWQFNKMQGFKHDGTTRTPATTWITSISENSDWITANDPCTQLLGTGWRIPTSAEWLNTVGGWYTTGYPAYNSSLKLHAAGMLYADGTLQERSTGGRYRSSTQVSASVDWNMGVYSSGAGMDKVGVYKAFGFSLRCLQDPVAVPFTTCGNTFIVTHTAGTVAPVGKTVSYGTVMTSLSGAPKCWITQNLGADNQAISATDSSENAAGWYWQFNRSQGYKHDGTNRTPATTWITGISESSDWLPANDPCALLLGTGWRIPTYSEWNNADSIGKWATTFATGAYTSMLKLNTSGFLTSVTSGALSARGGDGDRWSSTQRDLTTAWAFDFNSATYNALANNTKNFGFALRCLQDPVAVPFTSCGNNFVVTHTAGVNGAPVTKTVTYGTVATTLTGSNKCWITQNLGADNPANAGNDTREIAAGWYWQFNRMQGYKVADDATTRTPASWALTSISENSDWLSANDPCTLLLGGGWRIPTYTEWNNTTTGGGWAGYAATYSSVLKLHAAGHLDNSTGNLVSRGIDGFFWTSTQTDIANSWFKFLNVSSSTMVNNGLKAYGWTLRCLKDLPVPFTTCGNNFVVTHTAGTVAPVNKSVVYGTVLSSLSGASKCWITQNLGATNQATSSTDATEASSGWYWQFNRMQGYKMADDNTRTPASAWITPISESSDWLAANDPCTQLLGTGWRIPTSTEWINANTAGGWNNVSLTAAYSLLKLHLAGDLDNGSGTLVNRGTVGYYWSSVQSGANSGWYLNFSNGGSGILGGANTKTFGYPLRCLQDPAPAPFTTCGNSFTVTHTAGTVAPVGKTVTYGTVSSNLSGASKCWITQNLGATNQAASATDATEASSGWYWQFNRTQGYKLADDNTTRTPATTWITSISDSSDWLAANDPCALSLGTGWRIPTYTEWTNAKTTGSWTSYTNTFTSPLKLHAAGFLGNNDGHLSTRGSFGEYWGSTQSSTIGNGWYLTIASASTAMVNSYKAYGLNVRCLQDQATVPFTTCGNTFIVTHTAGTIAPVNKTVTYGTMMSNLSGANKCWITQNLGADRQATNANDSTEASAGWYWQFNRQQGYKSDDGAIRSPATTWVTSISESSDWVAANDPCTLLLGTGWRLPSQAEWSNVSMAWGNAGYPTGWNSPLKLHAAGYLNNSNGALLFRNSGSNGWYWSSTQSTTNYGLRLYIANGYSNLIINDKAYGFSVRCLQDPATTPFTTCGSAFVVTHTAGTVAPVTKTVSYGTVESSLSGLSQCWITQNLGADRQATSVADTTEASSGWYWQFNRSQGYKMADDNTTLTPAGWTTTTINESTDWVAASDPCTLLLGTGWRLPTNTEWKNTNTTAGWTNDTTGYASVFKLHAGGMLLNATGAITNRGTLGYFWSNGQSDATNGNYLGISSSTASAATINKASGLPVRCLKDVTPVAFTSCGNPFVVTHTAGNGIAPVTKTVTYGTVTSSLSGTSKCWITQNLGADRQATSATDATEASAGWYWQFNRTQGYKMADDGVTRTPSAAWDASKDATFTGWDPAKDPCTLLLGTGWRLPTNTEWTNANTTWGSAGFPTIWNSPLKLHAVGLLDSISGTLQYRSIYGYYWSSTQNGANGWYLGLASSQSIIYNYSKAYGYNVRCLKDFAPVAFTSCGNAFVVTHTTGAVAPVTKTVSYGTVMSNLSGANKCWITQNLGADNQASSATDATEASAGWYWQFNKMQGYKHDGTTRTPSTTWISSVKESSDWIAANDPCSLLLGAGWRIPTESEWTNAYKVYGWTDYNTTYASVLKMHAAGWLHPSTGALSQRGIGGDGDIHSSTQADSANGWNPTFLPTWALMLPHLKTHGFSVRCLKDATPVAFTTCGNTFVVTHKAGTVAPVTKTVSYGTVTTSLSGFPKCWITQNLGADNQASSATDASESSAGWYWQFNRAQGYKMASDGFTRTPATSWINNINETGDWAAANDPCTLLLGSGWRIPTMSEWINSNMAGVWTNSSDAYASILKLHSAGWLHPNTGVLNGRGSYGDYWSNTQNNTTLSGDLNFGPAASATYNYVKTYGFSLRCLRDSAIPFTGCGSAFVVTHTAGSIAPVNKTITYGTVLSNLSGLPKCWITQNLGADQQATSASDATEAAAGWYWQFNRKQGYKSADDGITRTPATPWISSINETSDWQFANDPCNQLLGNGWRIPTYTEWNNVYVASAWNNNVATYASVLKLHSAGFFNSADGRFYNRGADGDIWTSTQSDATNGWNPTFLATWSLMLPHNKAYAFSLRCLKDTLIPFTTCGNSFVVTHTAGTVAPVTKTVTYGTVTSALTGTGKCWITQNLGADHQATAATDATEASAGWYWQFNRPQGYKMADDGVTRTPNTTWISSISESSDWKAANDPCAQLLGSSWRIPTYTEWNTANTVGGWTNDTTAYASVLKLHTAGFLNSGYGALSYRGSLGYYWSSTQYAATFSWFEGLSSSYGRNSYSDSKAYGMPLRCLQDFAPTAFTTCGNNFVVTHTAATGGAPVTKTVNYGTVASALGGTGSKCWITQNLGADNQAASGSDATDAAAGWYWQFNRPQGYSNIATVTSPAWTITSISENSNWLAANDPCTLQLGSGWRLPTQAEWTNANSAGGWSTGYLAATYASPLKLHAAGYLYSTSGAQYTRGVYGNYLSSTQRDATTVWYLNFNSSYSYGNYDYKACGFSVRCLKDLVPVAFTTCGNPFVITHSAGTIAPVTKTVSYGTVMTSLSGVNKCWITQNLGADQQAGSITDSTEASAGWYWQFNGPQGYKVADDRTTRTPSAWTITSISETSDWLTANDPCTQLLGSGWRIPTYTEWNNINITGRWIIASDAYNSVLKLHSAGFIRSTNVFDGRGTYGNYWSSSQFDVTYGWYLNLYSGNGIGMYGSLNVKAYGFSLRCLKDLPVAFTTCGNYFVVTHTAGAMAPVTKTVTYGTVTSTLSGTNKCWITQNLGADHQATSVFDSTEASAGWYWQFNRPQGYKNDGVSLSPTWSATAISETSDWIAANDPCTQLSSNWRLPTATEWNSVNTNGGWSSSNFAVGYASVLKLHAAGSLSSSTGVLGSRGIYSNYWSSSQNNTTNGMSLNFINSSNNMNASSKTSGFTVRCISDICIGTVTAAISGGTSPIGYNTSPGLFTATGGGGSGAYTYLWYKNGTATGVATQTYDPGALTAAATIYCVVTSGVCGTATTSTTSITVNPMLTAVTSGGTTSVNYNNSPGTFTVTAGGGTGSYTYLWYLNGASTGITTPTYTPGNLTVTSAIYCAITSGVSGTVNTATTTVTVNCNLTAAISGGISPIISNTSPGVLTATGGGGSGVFTYLWYLNGVASGITTQTYNPGNLAATSTVYCAVTNGTCGTLNTSTTTITVTYWAGCGSALPVTHTAATGGAPVTKTVSYGTVTSSLSGASKCWITQNLGADQQATSATDSTNASAGWYWQFNRTQGYTNIVNAFYPATSAWDATNDGLYTGWDPAKDPCTLQLGTNWRLPTNTEWTNANSTGGWSTGYLAATYASPLKLHAAGYLSNGTLTNRSSYGFYWSSTQLNASYGWYLNFYSGGSNMTSAYKACGFSVRCLRDLAPVAFTTCGATFVVTHTAATGGAPVTKTVSYGTATSSLSGASKCWITQNLGADVPATSGTDATDAAAGWYWQFNRTQGYSNIATVTSPTSWDASNDNTYVGWDPAKDPCTLLLGSGWRLPTQTEYQSAVTAWGNAGYATTFGSALKLHAAGNLGNSSLSNRSSIGYYWSSTQNDASYSWTLNFNSSGSSMGSAISKANGNSVRCLRDLAPVAFTTCGSTFIVTHTAATGGAPVTKTVSYGTVTSSLSGVSKCWITQNLGADQAATSGTDATDAAAGWNWQFGLPQGYSNITGVTSPAWTITSISTSSDWLIGSDPCAIQLGSGWRLPTQTEWTNVNSAWGSAGYPTGYNSPLKLHAAGELYTSSGTLGNRSSGGYYWSSSTQNLANYGWYLAFSSGGSNMYGAGKAFGYSVRCLRDPDPVAFTTCGSTFIVTHTAATGGAPATKTVSYGTVASTLGGTGSKCWITQNLGADVPATSGTDATDAAAGWYWQFGLPQGYSNIATVTSPAWTITSISTSSDWLIGSDPCAIQLGSGWRLPTQTEWTNANSTGGWTNYTTTYASPLKLHAAGYLDYSNNGALSGRSSSGLYRSSTQFSSRTSWILLFSSGFSYMDSYDKAYGYSVRCLKD